MATAARSLSPVLRAAIVVLVSSWALATTLPDILLPWHPLATFGFYHSGGVVSRITPGGPADAAGLRAGDRIDLTAMSAEQRRHLYGAVYANSARPGEPLTLPVERGGTRYVVTIRSVPFARSVADNVSDVILILSQCAFVLIASWLVFARPGLMTWAFYTYAIANVGLSTLVNAWLTLPAFLVQFGVAYFLSGIRAPAFAVFAMRFPRDRATPAMRYLEVALVPIGIALGALNCYAGIAPTVYGNVTGGENALVALSNSIIYGISAVAFIVGYGQSARGDRQRIEWIVVGLVAGFGGSTAFDVVRWVFPVAVSVPLYNAMYSLNVLLPIAIAYAIVRHRIIDVNFFISRTVVLTGVLALVAGSFAALDWSLSAAFSGMNRNASLYAGGIVVLVLGIAMPKLYAWISEGVERYLFSREYQARAQVRRLAAGLPYAQTGSAIAATLTDGVCGALSLPSSAVFRRDGNDAYVRETAVGWATDEDIPALDAERLAMDLQGARSMLRIAEEHLSGARLPRGDREPVVAFPLHARQALIGYVLYSAHAHGADLDPDDLKLLGDVTREASRGYDAVELAARVERAYAAKAEAQAETVETIKRSSAVLERVNEAQARFMPNEFLRYLGKESIVDVDLGDSVQRMMTVLFSDIRSFTTLSEGMTPSEIFAFLNRYLHQAEPIVSENGGFIDKYIGDAIMGLFPASADDALKAAIELQHEVRVFNRKVEDEGLPRLAIGVGLHTGELMLGTIGGRHRMETTVIADAVNAASRLESATKTLGCGIVLSKETCDALSDPERFMLRFLGTLHVKGKAQGLAIYEAFDADPPDVVVRKQSSRDVFAKGLSAFEAGDRAVAREFFSSIVEENAADGPAAYYLELSRGV